MPYYDLSGLFGNCLTARLFDVNLLDPQTVITSVLSQPRYDDFNIYVIANEKRKALSPSEFNRPYKEGDYQNGADWPFFTIMAQEESERNGAPHNLLFWQKKIQLMMESRNAEYIKPSESGIVYNSSRINHAWNAAAYTIAKEVIGTNNYLSIILPIQDNLISEASQLPGATL